MAKLLPFVAPVPSRWRRLVNEARVLQFLTRQQWNAKRWCDYCRWQLEQRLAAKRATVSHQVEPLE